MGVSQAVRVLDACSVFATTHHVGVVLVRFERRIAARQKYIVCTDDVATFDVGWGVRSVQERCSPLCAAAQVVIGSKRAMSATRGRGKLGNLEGTCG